MIAKLYPYQEEGLRWLTTKKFALLGDQMGLGKSAQVIRAADSLGLRRIVVVGPAVSRYTWKHQFEKWSTLPNRRIRMLEKNTQKPDHNDEVILVSFEYATRNSDTLRTWAKDLLVVDESHFIKSIDAKRTQAILGKTGIVHGSPRSWFLTGTPMPNHPAELWPFMRAAGLTNLTYDSFVSCFCTTYDFNGRKVVTGAKQEHLPRLKKMLDPVMLRRITREVLKDLPPVTVSEIFVEADLKELPAIPVRHEEILKSLLISDINAQMDALEVMAGSVATLRRYCAVKKIGPVSDIIREELESNAYKKIVIFCWHTEVVNGLIQALREYNPAVVVGDGSSAEKRQREVDRFQNSSECRVFIGNIKAAGTNITLTAANQVFFMEQSWVPGDNQQAIARCARIGQTLPVNVRYASIVDSIDQKINEILFRKMGDITKLFGVS